MIGHIKGFSIRKSGGKHSDVTAVTDHADMDNSIVDWPTNSHTAMAECMWNAFVIHDIYSCSPVFPPQPFQLLQLPLGTYGICFDLFDHRITNHLPDGWGLRSASTIYTRVRRRLERAGYEHHQASVYQQENTLAILT